MTDKKLLFLTGRLAEPRLAETVAAMGLPNGSWRIANLGIKVAALMTENIVRNRLKEPLEADRVIVPGRSRMNLGHLAEHYGVPFERGPDEIIDLPQFFGHDGRPPDLSKQDIRIFAEIVDAPGFSVEKLVERGRELIAKGGDVVDIGCQPDVNFPHLEDTVAALKREGFKVSVDSGDTDELRRGARAGADYVLSLDESNLDAIEGTQCVPILLPRPHGDLDSLLRAIDLCKAKGIPHIADPVLDPINFGFMTSLERYAELRRARPDVEILMGTGNLTELTDADSGGVTAMLIGICTELAIRNVLIVQVSPHTRRTVEEHDAARRLMYRAREDNNLPKGYGNQLLSLHDVRPFPDTPEQIAENGERGERCQLPHRGGGRRPAHLQSRRPPHRRRPVRAVRQARRGERRRARILSRLRASQGRDGSRPRQALCAGHPARLGRRRRQEIGRPDTARARRRNAASRTQGEAGCRVSSKRS